MYYILYNIYYIIYIIYYILVVAGVPRVSKPSWPRHHTFREDFPKQPPTANPFCTYYTVDDIILYHIIYIYTVI